MGYDERHWFDILSALGAYPPTGAFGELNDNTEHVARTTSCFAARFPNGAVSIAPHLRDVEECWEGGFHRNDEADARVVERLSLPGERLELKGFRADGHEVDYRGDGAVAFRLDGEGRLVAFAGRAADRIRVDGKETVFAERPLPLVAWAPVPAERRVEGGAVLVVRAAGAADLRIPAPGVGAAAHVYREEPTPGSRGRSVESRIEDGTLLFRTEGGNAWYYVVPVTE